MNGSRARTVVLVHGLWFGAWWMWLLERRLRKAGFSTCRFRYRSARGELEDHAAALRDYLSAREEGGTDFVAHSLGGLVVLRMLADSPAWPAGRVVLLGSPLTGSAVACRSAHIPGFARLLGKVRPALEAGFAKLPADWQVGVIAGARSFGLGWLVGGPGGPSDGTVAVSETRTEGLRDHLVLPVTHTGLLFSRAVVRQASGFLRSGSFNRAP